MNEQEILEVFRAYLIRQNKQSKIALIVLSVIIGGMIVGGFFFETTDDTEEMYKMIILGVLGVVLLLVLYVSFGQKGKYDPKDSPIINAIKYKNDDGYFTWIYPYTFVKNNVPYYSITFMSKDKKEYLLNLKSEQDFALIEHLRPIIQNVTYGYSDELKAQYKKDPQSLSV